MPSLAPRKRHSRNETRDLTKPILVALNKLPGVRVARNNVGVSAQTTDVYIDGEYTKRVIRHGLGNGSADLVGIVEMRYWPKPAGVYDPYSPLFGRVFCLEVKWPGKKQTTDQVRWAKVVRSLGGFVAIVHSVDEAVAAVARCREGANE